MFDNKIKFLQLNRKQMRQMKLNQERAQDYNQDPQQHE